MPLRVRRRIVVSVYFSLCTAATIALAVLGVRLPL